VTSLAYVILRQSGSVVYPATVQRPTEDTFRTQVFDAVAGGRYEYYSGRIFRLGDAFSLFVVGRVDPDDAEAILRAATTSWSAMLGM